MEGIDGLLARIEALDATVKANKEALVTVQMQLAYQLRELNTNYRSLVDITNRVRALESARPPCRDTDGDQ